MSEQLDKILAEQNFFEHRADAKRGQDRARARRQRDIVGSITRSGGATRDQHRRRALVRAFGSAARKSKSTGCTITARMIDTGPPKSWPACCLTAKHWQGNRRGGGSGAGGRGLTCEQQFAATILGGHSKGR
jgi:hypothetical protein